MAKKINYIHTTLGTEVTATESSGFTEVVESSALTSGKTYYVVCHALVDGSSANGVFEWRLLDNTNTAQLADSTLTKEPRAANETDSYTFVGKFTAGGDGGGLEFQQKAAASQTVRTQYVSMLIFDLTNMRSDDYFLVSDSTATEHTASYVNRVSKTVSRADAGDEWLVFAWGSFSLDSAGGGGKSAAMALAFTDGGSTATAEPEVYEYGGDLTDVLNHMFTRTFTPRRPTTTRRVHCSDFVSTHLPTLNPCTQVGPTITRIQTLTQRQRFPLLHLRLAQLSWRVLYYTPPDAIPVD